MGKYSVMICDDNAAIHNSLSSYLRNDDIDIISVFNGEDAIKKAKSDNIDIIVLDIMLPGIDGLEVCRSIRKFKSKIYIIMLSARADEIDRINGLEVGADDYVVKPFSPRELSIRVKNAIRRLYSINDINELSLAELRIYPDSYKAYVNDQEVQMTPKEIKTLSFMISNAGKVLTREQILNFVWGYEYYGDTRVVDTLIKRVRQKLTIQDNHFKICSVYGVGYKIEETNEYQN